MRQFTEDHKRKISEAKKGKKQLKEHKEKISKSMINLYLTNSEFKEKQKRNSKRGSNHPMFGKIGGFSGRKHSEETKNMMSLKQQGTNHPSYGKQRKKISNDKTSESCKQWWNTEEGMKARKKQSEKMKSGMSARANSFIANPSKPQVKLYNIVKSFFESTILNYSLVDLNYSLDIAIPDLKIWIESDGLYWHKDKEKDIERENKIQNLGWKCIRYVCNTIKDVPPPEQIYFDIINMIKG